MLVVSESMSAHQCSHQTCMHLVRPGDTAGKLSAHPAQAPPLLPLLLRGAATSAGQGTARLRAALAN